MALFDRRLLAYFDDGLGAGSTTLLDRIIDYQKDLAEIERELKKYKMLLGDREVQCKIRDPEKWINKNKGQKTIKERYRKAAQEIVDVEPDEPEHGYPERRRASVSERRPSMARVKARNSRQSVSSRGSVARASMIAGSKALWVQIDTIYRLPQPRADSYVVKTHWIHHPATAIAASEKFERDENNEDVCIVRQQLKLEAQPNAQIVVITVYSGAGDSERRVGECQLNAEETRNHEVQVHYLSDDGRRSAEIRLRLTYAGSSHDPDLAGATRKEHRDTRRPSNFAVAGSESSASRRTSNQQGRRSVALTSIQEGTGSAQEVPASRRTSIRPTGVQIVTQDPAALETSNPPGRLSTAAQHAKDIAAVAGQHAKSTASTPAISEAPTPGGPDDELDEEYTEEEEEEEQLESSPGEEFYEEGDEEEIEGDEEEDAPPP